MNRAVGTGVRLLFFILIPCLLGHVIFRPAPAMGFNGETNGVPLYLRTDATFYCDNLEYDNAYQVGRTFFGAHASLCLAYVKPHFDLSLGAFVQREFGDEDEISKALPLFRFRYKRPHFQLLAGHLDSGYNHGLPEALLAQEYAFAYPVEEGLQVLARVKNLKADAWINWYLLNTQEHREFFAAGAHAEAVWTHLSVDLGFRMSHHGGQLFDTGPVSDNFSGMLRFVLSDEWPALDAEIGISGTLLGSIDIPDREMGGTRTEGYGGEGECFLSPKGWKFYYRIFSGHDLLVEQGELIYRTPKPLHRFGLRKTFHLDEQVRARFQVEGLIIDSSLEYNYFLVIDVFLNLFLHRFPGA